MNWHYEWLRLKARAKIGSLRNVKNHQTKSQCSHSKRWMIRYPCSLPSLTSLDVEYRYRHWHIFHINPCKAIVLHSLLMHTYAERSANWKYPLWVLQLSIAILISSFGNSGGRDLIIISSVTFTNTQERKERKKEKENIFTPTKSIHIMQTSCWFE